MKSTLCLGGSFNPIHNAHLLCARTAAEQLGFDRIVLIPSANPPLKSVTTDMASALDRLAMAHLAIAETIGFAVNDMELHRTGPSYTLDTVRELKFSGAGEVHWLIGADALKQLPEWHQIATLLKEVQFHVMQRPGVPIDWTTLPANIAKLEKQTVTTPAIDISATEIRNRIRAGLPIDFLTPPTVVRYIREHSLYMSHGHLARGSSS